MFAADNLFGCYQVSVRRATLSNASPSDHHVTGQNGASDDLLCATLA